MNVHHLFALLTLAVSPLMSADEPSTKWRSAHHPIVLAVQRPFELFPQQIDRKGRVRVLFIDQQDGTSIHLRIEEEHALLVLTEEAYRKMLREGLSAGRILDEREVSLFGAKWQRIRGELVNERWQTRMIVDIHYRLVGRTLALIQWAFPCKEPSADSPLPSKIQLAIEQSAVFSQN